MDGRGNLPVSRQTGVRCHPAFTPDRAGLGMIHIPHSFVHIVEGRWTHPTAGNEAVFPPGNGMPISMRYRFRLSGR